MGPLVVQPADIPAPVVRADVVGEAPANPAVVLKANMRGQR
jgi:hypothetical protein